MRTIGSESERLWRARLMLEGEARELNSVSAPARAKAGAVLSAATAARRFAAFGWSLHAAVKASA